MYKLRQDIQSDSRNQCSLPELLETEFTETPAAAPTCVRAPDSSALFPAVLEASRFWDNIGKGPLPLLCRVLWGTLTVSFGTIAGWGHRAMATGSALGRVKAWLTIGVLAIGAAAAFGGAMFLSTESARARVCSEYDAAVEAVEMHGGEVLAVSRADGGYWVRLFDGQGYVRDEFIPYDC